MVFLRSASRLARPASLLASSRTPASTSRASLFRPSGAVRTLTSTNNLQGKVLLCLYDVSVSSLAWHWSFNCADLILQGHEHAQQEPQLLGTTENELGIRKWIEDQGHTLVTTSDKEGPNSKFEKELEDAEVIITTP